MQKKNKEKNSSENTEVLQTKGFEYALNVLLVISPLVKNCRATNPQKLSYTPFIYTVSPQESGTLEKTTNLKPSLYLADRCGKYKSSQTAFPAYTMEVPPSFQ